jgi:hypothetical protein
MTINPLPRFFSSALLSNVERLSPTKQSRKRTFDVIDHEEQAPSADHSPEPKASRLLKRLKTAPSVLMSGVTSPRVDEKTKKAHVDTNPLKIKPLGNLLLNPDAKDFRQLGLGKLALLPDDLLLLSIFSHADFEGEDLLKIQGVSKWFFAFVRIEGLWKTIYLKVRT